MWRWCHREADARRTHFQGFLEVRTHLRSPQPSLTHFLRDAHPTSSALMRTDGPYGLRFALPGAEDIYARSWRTVADSGSIVTCVEGVFECSE